MDTDAPDSCRYAPSSLEASDCRDPSASASISVDNNSTADRPPLHGNSPGDACLACSRSNSPMTAWRRATSARARSRSASARCARCRWYLACWTSLLSLAIVVGRPLIASDPSLTAPESVRALDLRIGATGRPQPAHGALLGQLRVSRVAHAGRSLLEHRLAQDSVCERRSAHGLAPRRRAWMRLNVGQVASCSIESMKTPGDCSRRTELASQSGQSPE